MIKKFKLSNLLHMVSIFLSTLWKFFVSTILKITTKFWSVRNQKTKYKPFPPGPKPWPIVGCLPQMLLNKKPASQWIHKLMEEMETEIACIRLGSVHVIPVTSPELACDFLKKQDSVFSSRPICMSANLVSNGFLTSVFLPMGDQWIKMRRILASHVLSPTSLRWLRHKRDEEADHLLRFIYDRCLINQPVIDLRKVTRYYSANVITNMIFSKRLLGKRMGKNEGPSHVQVEEVQVFIDAVFTLLEYLHAFSISDYLPWLSRFDLDGHKAIIKKAFAIARKYIDHDIDQRIKIWKDGKKDVEEDILDVLIMLKDTNGNPLMNVNVNKAQVLELILATVDNPSNAVEWTIREMLNQPKIMQMAIEEIDTVIGSSRLVQESDLPQLNYVKACIKEAFRLHPISSFNVPHVSVSDTIVGEYFIPKGSVVLLSRIGLGRNPRVWEDPMKFKPERHLNEESREVVLTDSELRLLSFSIGRRGCPAVQLGSTITIMLLARLLQGFTWSLLPNSPGNDLVQNLKCDLSCTMPLFARAKPRLSKGMYL